MPHCNPFVYYLHKQKIFLLKSTWKKEEENDILNIYIKEKG